jgi:tellurite resistance protein TehA-like permease
MASGVVSLDLASDGFDTLSIVVLVLGAAAWLAAFAHGELWREAAGVAATAVLATRLEGLGWTAAAWLLAAGAVVLWGLTVPRVSLARPATGSDFLPTVATQSLAVLAAVLGGSAVAAVGAALWVVGLALYLGTVVRFELAQLTRGAGDQWVAGGALAISALACAELGHAGAPLAPWRDASIVLWIAAAAWLPLLVAGELARPRLSGAPARWSTVFPLGMYAAMSFAVGRLAGIDWMRSFARGWTWVAAAAWALVLLDAASRWSASGSGGCTAAPRSRGSRRTTGRRR